MGKTLIITEKPSVAQDIARALGGFKKHKEYFENDRYVISWAVGHLLELAVPAAMKAQDKWALDKLPIMPTQFDLQPAEKAATRLKVLKKLLNSDEISDVINACDAGREGELIFRYIYQYAGCRKPIRRLWLQSMTPDAIRQGFEQLRTDEEMQPLAAAARCRNEADWLVGINATRAFTLRLRGGRGSTVTTLGRVQTPTLAIIVEREQKIQAFRERVFWEVIAHFQAADASYTGRWFDEQYRKDESETERTMRLGATLTSPELIWDEHRAAHRLWEKTLADRLVAKCAGKPGIVELEEKKPSTQPPPQLYDLTALQRDANTRHGFSAGRTLRLAQALYEKHKAITYPRTDSRCLPEDYLATVKKTLAKLGPLAEKVLQQGWVRPNKRIFNNARVSDHFAIIPTGDIPTALERDEQLLFDMIVKRFIAVFYPAAEYELTTRITRVEGEPFKTEGKILRAPGWLEVYGKEAMDKPGENLPAVSEGQQVHTERLEIKDEKTKPPPRYTEATILSAMESAGKLVEDEELREAMKERGLGTPATRAEIIETLIKSDYLVRHGRELHPTAKAMQTVALLKEAVPELVSPELTGEWEYRLSQIEHRRLPAAEFMEQIRELTAHIVKEAKEFKPDEQVKDATPFGKCPRCAAALIERFRSFKCTQCDFSVWKTIAGRLLSRDEFETLLRDRRVGPLSGFRSKTGRRFSAILKLTDDLKIEFAFEENPAGLTCEKCGKPMVIRSGRRGEFLACSGYPDCKNAMNFTRDESGRIVPLPKPETPSLPAVDISCEKCGQPMAIKMSRRGPFLACTGYPKCKNAQPLPPEVKSQLPKPPAAVPDPTGEKCENCGAPMVRRQSRHGPFLGCSRYPQCKTIKKIASPVA